MTQTPSRWPGKKAGIRPPDPGETPLSWDEVKHLLGVKRLTGKESIHDQDDFDSWPIERRFIPAGLWGIRTPGLRKAHPFDGLIQSGGRS
jgi:hypothetical protein